jgi:hypothetical protein
MTADTLTVPAIDEAEAIVRAEWLRIEHDDALRGHEYPTVCSEEPDARPRPVKCAAVILERPRPTPLRRRAGWSPKCGPVRRVWPTQRSPPLPCGKLVDCQEQWR